MEWQENNNRPRVVRLFSIMTVRGGGVNCTDFAINQTVRKVLRN